MRIKLKTPNLKEEVRYAIEAGETDSLGIAKEIALQHPEAVFYAEHANGKTVVFTCNEILIAHKHDINVFPYKETNEA